MPWTKPDFEEITLNMEVTAYVNTDDKAAAGAVVSYQLSVASTESAGNRPLTTDN